MNKADWIKYTTIPLKAWRDIPDTERTRLINLFGELPSNVLNWWNNIPNLHITIEEAERAWEMFTNPLTEALK